MQVAATGEGGCTTAESSTGATTAVAHTYPNVTDFVWDIPAHEDGRAMTKFTAVCYSNPNIGAGPLNLYPADLVPDHIQSDALYATYFVDPAELPTVNCDETTAHPAPRVITGS